MVEKENIEYRNILLMKRDEIVSLISKKVKVRIFLSGKIEYSGVFNWVSQPSPTSDCLVYFKDSKGNNPKFALSDIISIEEVSKYGN